MRRLAGKVQAPRIARGVRLREPTIWAVTWQVARDDDRRRVKDLIEDIPAHELKFTTLNTRVSRSSIGAMRRLMMMMAK